MDLSASGKSTLTAARRKRLSKSKFGLPGKRKYPVDTKARAANAKARAAQQVKKGNLSPSARAQIDAAANRKLYGSAKAPAGRTA